jgi:aryl-alcohol dehydrogenase-like predicted oxidoreductase
VVIATKSGERRFDPAAGLSRRYIIHQVEHSLRRLGTDYIDVYYAHLPDPDTPLEQTLMVYDDLVRQGKCATWPFPLVNYLPVARVAADRADQGQRYRPRAVHRCSVRGSPHTQKRPLVSASDRLRHRHHSKKD